MIPARAGAGRSLRSVVWGNRFNFVNMSKINLEKIKKIFYEHWKITFPFLIPFFATFLLSFWQYFRELMLKNVPFYLLFVTLFILSYAIVIIFLKQKKIKILISSVEQEEQTILINNLLYKIGDYSQAYCPFCYEKNKRLHRMRRYYHEDKESYLYNCFVCDHNEYVGLSKEENIDLENIPF